MFRYKNEYFDDCDWEDFVRWNGGYSEVWDMLSEIDQFNELMDTFLEDKNYTPNRREDNAVD